MRHARAALLILDTALDAVVGMDAQGLITEWNPQAEVTFGWSRDEALGRRLSATRHQLLDLYAQERQVVPW